MADVFQSIPGHFSSVQELMFNLKVWVPMCHSGLILKPGGHQKEVYYHKALD
jgi:hypothetical protein